MANRPGILRANLGCIVRLAVAGAVLSALACAGSCAGIWSLFWAGIHGPPEVRDRPLVIRGGAYFDGERDLRTGWLVLIDGDRIACAGPSCRVPVHAEVLEAKDLLVTPGWIDLHVHLGAPAGAEMGRSVPAQMWSTLRHRPAVRRSLLEAGVTTVRSVGDDLMTVRNQQTWLADGTIGGPSVHTAGPVFTAPGGHPADKLAATPWLIDGSTRQVDDADRARTRVHEVIDQGVQGIKVVFDDGDGRVPKLDPEVMRTVVAEARGRGVWVAVHTGTDADVRAAVEAGATTIEHGARDPLSDETIAAMREAGVVFVPTLAVVEALAPGRLPTYSENARRAHEAGVAIGVGSDTQGPAMDFGASTRREVALLVEAGLPAQEVLRSVTSVGGRALGVEGLGRLVEGAPADLVLFRGELGTLGALEPVVVLQAGRIAVDRR